MEDQDLLELRDVIEVELPNGSRPHYEVVAMVEDHGQPFAIGFDSIAGFIVTNPYGDVIEDTELTRGIMQDFLALAYQETA